MFRHSVVVLWTSVVDYLNCGIYVIDRIELDECIAALKEARNITATTADMDNAIDWAIELLKECGRCQDFRLLLIANQETLNKLAE